MYSTLAIARIGWFWLYVGTDAIDEEIAAEIEEYNRLEAEYSAKMQ